MIIDVVVPGIHCTGCTGRIERILNKQEGVTSAKADVNSKLVTIDFDPAVIDTAAIRSAIERLGFTCEI